LRRLCWRHASLSVLAMMLIIAAIVARLTPVQAVRVLVLFKDDSGAWFQAQQPPAATECPNAAKSATGLSIRIVWNETRFYTAINASCSEVFNLENGTYTVYTTLSPKMYDLSIQENSVISVNSQGELYLAKARLFPEYFCGDRICLHDEICQIDCRNPPAPTGNNRLCEMGETCWNCSDCNCSINEYCKDNTTCVPLSLNAVSECGNNECELGETPTTCAKDCRSTIAVVCPNNDNLTEYETALVANLRKNGFSVSILGSIPETFRDFNGVILSDCGNKCNATQNALELKNGLAEFARSGGGVAFMGKGPLLLSGDATGWQLGGIAKELLASERLENSSKDWVRFEDDSPFGSGEITMDSPGIGISGVSNDDANTSIIAYWEDGPIFALNRTFGKGRVIYWSTTDGPASLASGFVNALKYCTNASHTTTALPATVQTICGDGVCSEKEYSGGNCCEDCGCPSAGMKCVEGACIEGCSVNEEMMADAVVRLGRARASLLKAAMKTRQELNNESIAARLELLANNVSLESRSLTGFSFNECDAFRNSVSRTLLELKSDASKIAYELTAIMVRANNEHGAGEID